MWYEKEAKNQEKFDWMVNRMLESSETVSQIVLGDLRISKVNLLFKNEDAPFRIVKVEEVTFDARD